MPNVQTVSLGIFIDTGSRDETEQEAGIAHALEHMLFKGTQHLSAPQLNQAFDNLGGQVNAFTGRERTCYHIHVLHEDWPEALRLLTSMIIEPELDEQEWQRERQVIFSEMGMVEDSPEEWLADQHMELLFSNNPLGKPTLGTKKSLLNIDSQQLRQYLSQHYCAANILIAAAGRIQHDTLCESFDSTQWSQDNQQQVRHIPTHQQGLHLLPKDMEQAQCIASWTGLNATSTQKPQLWLANQMLGGSMSSMLFQEVREKHGLAYQVASYYSTYSDIGCWSIACGTDKDRLSMCLDVIKQSVQTWMKQDIQAEQLKQAKRQLQVQLRMSMDSVEGNMLHLAHYIDEPILYSNQYWADQINNVSSESIHQLIHEHFQREPLWSILAPQSYLDAFSGNNHKL
ncbi:MAG: pitrilysin family protein [Mariprofundaceae bacterium]|nr:pitrilysin family protein [Mariprofundaceae bacterium]